MLKLAHVVNAIEITDASRGSYLHVAQPVTLASMVTAKRMAEQVVAVDLFGISHATEEVELPGEFNRLPDIQRYAYDVIAELKNVTPKKPLPLLRDILQPVMNHTDAEYLIYTNLDIGLFPNFYLRLTELIGQGYDAMCINRRTLPKSVQGVTLDDKTLPLIYMLEGHQHVGIDCFVFKLQVLPKLDLGNVFVGFPPIGQVLRSQIEDHSSAFWWEKRERLTFHLGDDQVWRGRRGDYARANFHAAEGRRKKWNDNRSFLAKVHSRLRTNAWR